MRGWVRKAFVVAIALAFAASGPAWRHCLAAQATPENSIASHHGSDGVGLHAHGANRSMHHGDHSSVSPGPAKNHGPGTTDNYACEKCCSICTVAAAIQPFTDVTVFTVSSILFSNKANHFSGTIIFVDPGIPKRTV
jgi:hypothetical protein